MPIRVIKKVNGISKISWKFYIFYAVELQHKVDT